MNPNAAKPKVVVLGGGFAGLETAFALRAALPDQADITLISDDTSFLFRPHTIYIPFGMDEDKLRVDIVKPARRKGIRFVEARAYELDTVRRTLDRDAGDGLQRELYDYLVIAAGVRPRLGETPGLAEYGHTLGSAESMLRLRDALAQVLERAGRGETQQILLALPPNAAYSAPVYEMSLMLDQFLREKDVRGRVMLTFVTCEASYLESFGPLLHDLLLERFEERRIAHDTRMNLTRIEAGVAHFSGRPSLPFDLFIALPPAGAAVPFAALPSNERGYLSAKLATRRVTGLDDVFAAGDASDFPIKQAFMALLQADVIAEGIAADIQGRLPRFVFEPVSQFVMEAFDTGLFAQTPFSASDGLRVAADSPSYKAGSSPLWFRAASAGVSRSTPGLLPLASISASRRCRASRPPAGGKRRPPTTKTVSPRTGGSIRGTKSGVYSLRRSLFSSARANSP